MSYQQDKQRIAANRIKAIEFLGGKCANCGSMDRLEFDHIDDDRNNDRGRCVSRLLSYSWERILVELKLCQLLCKSCHIEKTIKDKGFNKVVHGLFSTYTNKKCRCSDCRAANANYMRKYALSGVE
jgi:5-methylcytosine-specific restriction endonuclease McrA